MQACLILFSSLSLGRDCVSPSLLSLLRQLQFSEAPPNFSIPLARSSKRPRWNGRFLDAPYMAKVHKSVGIGTTSCQRGSKAYGLRGTIILAHNPNPDEFGGWRIFLCPNSSFSLSKLEFLAFQTEVSSLWKKIVKGLTKFYRFVDNFLSPCW